MMAEAETSAGVARKIGPRARKIGPRTQKIANGREATAFPARKIRSSRR